MAYYYTLSIECGANSEDVKLCQQHFNDLTIDLGEKKIDFITEVHQFGAWWITVFSLQLPSSGMMTTENVDLFTSVGEALLNHLSNLSNYRFAVLGVESVDAIQYEEFDEHLIIDEKFIENFSGLVISKSILSKTSNQKAFNDFSRRHVALTPYQIKIKK